MKTYFASYKRATREAVQRDYMGIRSMEYIPELICSLPYVASILNEDRQIVFSNDALLKKLNFSMDQILGKRPGEAFACIHADVMEAGCGTSKNCRVCGAVNTVLRCQETGKTATDECRIRIRDGAGGENCMDLEVTASPLQWGNHKFIVFTARDISSEKRREALERIFFHDVINTAGTLQGVVDLLKQIEDPKKIRSYIDLLSVVSQDLTDEILNQKSLLAAENGELAVSMRTFYLKETLERIVGEYRRHELALNKEIHLPEDPCEITVHTDPALLKRVVSNMIKNALEAIAPEEKITIDCILGADSVIIRVHNPGQMPEAVQQQVFQRSFSTKGKGRGLGTYSMKLLGEKYLRGKVAFSSNAKEGTAFSLELPLK